MTIANESRRNRISDLTLEELQRLRSKHEAWLDDYSDQSADNLTVKAQILMNLLRISSEIGIRLGFASTVTQDRQRRRATDRAIGDRPVGT